MVAEIYHRPARIELRGQSKGERCNKWQLQSGRNGECCSISKISSSITSCCHKCFEYFIDFIAHLRGISVTVVWKFNPRKRGRSGSVKGKFKKFTYRTEVYRLGWENCFAKFVHTLVPFYYRAEIVSAISLIRVRFFLNFDWDIKLSIGTLAKFWLNLPSIRK